MRLKNQPITLNGPGDSIQICRNQDGIPVISAQNSKDMAYAFGWVHANDRQLQVLLTRILAHGRAAECLKNDPALIEIDQYMRRMNFLPDPQNVLAKLETDTREQLEAYADGFNDYISENGLVFELRLLGYRYEPWAIADSILIEKLMGFIGLADAQANMEKFLIQMIQKGVAADKIKELFPYLTEPIDYELIKSVRLAPPIIPEAQQWLDRLPRFNASNNWALSGSHTASGSPILCGDPHLEVNRLPAIWQEIVVHLPDNCLMGGTIPGMPGVGVGRSKHVSWSATYSFMDLIDYRIEECQDGCYKRPDGWKPFKVREEQIKVKKGEPLKLVAFENEHGVLEGDPYVPGRYLVLCWSAHRDCGAMDMNCLMKLPFAENVAEMMALFKGVEAVGFNWVMADTDGNIGFQMSGRCFKRPSGISGLLPTPGWDPAFDPDGFIHPDKLPFVYNPPEGFVVTANEDLNYMGQVDVINLPMGTYRADRIKQLLRQASNVDVAYMQHMHYDLFSLQAERFMDILRPLLPDTENGNTLKEWDLTYEADSQGAMLFESVYQALIHVIFGDNGLGRAIVAHITEETGLFNDYYANLDNIMFQKGSAWFNGQDRDALFKEAITEGLRITARPWGETRQVVMAHLLFGGQLPRWIGFDYGPFALPGSRATIPQGQIFKSAGRVTTFSPSYRLIADMSTQELHTNLAGGPSDRRFSSLYTTDIQNWLHGRYKILR